MALQIAPASLGDREGRGFQRLPEKPPQPAAERRLPPTAKRFHTVCLIFASNWRAPLPD